MDRKHKRLYSSLEKNEDLIPEMIFDEDRIRDIYLDRYDSVQTEISQVTSFDKSTDLSTTYLGKTDMTREYVIKAEEKFPNYRTQAYKWQVNGQNRMYYIDRHRCM